MKSIQLEQNVTRGDEFRLAVATRGVGSERVVTRHVRMDNLDSLSSHKLFKLMCALHVERVSQRQGQDLFRRQLQMPR